MVSNPWREIGLDVYESHMSHRAVGQLELLKAITAAQAVDHSSRRVGILGIAGGNGLDALDPTNVDALYGYDINPQYLEQCRARYADEFRDRLHLVECSIDRDLRIDHVDLLIANLVIEYVGVDEFAAFVAANAPAIGVLSCVTQQNRGAGIVSTTEHSSAFAALETIASEIAPESLAAALVATGSSAIGRTEYPLPNGKVLIRQDFLVAP